MKRDEKREREGMEEERIERGRNGMESNEKGMNRNVMERQDNWKGIEGGKGKEWKQEERNEKGRKEG